MKFQQRIGKDLITFESPADFVNQAIPLMEKAKKSADEIEAKAKAAYSEAMKEVRAANKRVAILQELITQMGGQVPSVETKTSALQPESKPKAN